MCFLGDNPDELTILLNYAVVKAERVRLKCSTQKYDTGFWFRNTPLDADQILIYHKTIRNQLFSVDESVPGLSDLLFVSSKSTAGTYGCDSVDVTHTAEVVVLGKYLGVHFCLVGLLKNVI